MLTMYEYMIDITFNVYCVETLYTFTESMD